MPAPEPGDGLPPPLPRWRLVRGTQGTGSPVLRAWHSPVVAATSLVPASPTSEVSLLRTAACWSLRGLGPRRRVAFVLAVVPVSKLNCPNIAGPEAEPPQLVRSGAHGMVPGINRLTGLEERDMPVARPTVIPEGGEAGVTRAIGGLEGNAAPHS